MDTSKYDPQTRRTMKRATRHPLYRALHTRFKETQSELLKTKQRAGAAERLAESHSLVIADLENQLEALTEENKEMKRIAVEMTAVGEGALVARLEVRGRDRLGLSRQLADGT